MKVSNLRWFGLIKGMSEERLTEVLNKAERVGRKRRKLDKCKK
jgi:hypothetical protein